MTPEQMEAIEYEQAEWDKTTRKAEAFDKLVEKFQSLITDYYYGNKPAIENVAAFDLVYNLTGLEAYLEPFEVQMWQEIKQHVGLTCSI